jgi:hypothetical protein
MDPATQGAALGWLVKRRWRKGRTSQDSDSNS